MMVLALGAIFVLVRMGWIYGERAQSMPLAKVERVAGIPKELDTLELKILNFYTVERPVRGEPFLVCYGVLNAVSVKLEPPLAEVAPVLSRCVEVTLHKETQLTLRAHGKNGEEVAASFVLGVNEPRPEFVFVSIKRAEAQAGGEMDVVLWGEEGGEGLAGAGAEAAGGGR